MVPFFALFLQLGVVDQPAAHRLNPLSLGVVPVISPVGLDLNRIAGPLLPDVNWYPGMPAVRLAVGSSRYNRIEALSLAGVAGSELSGGSILAAELRLGAADLVPNFEVEWTTADIAVRRGISVYHRLAHTADWGNPLAMGASLGAFFFGRDDGFYYRAAGAEVRYSDSARVDFKSRAFVERHRSAFVKNDFALPDLAWDHSFGPNITASEGDIAGVELAIGMRRGEMPDERRLFGELRLEGATGTFSYLRGMAEGMIYQPLWSTVLASLSVSGGTSGGELPLQRNWYLGGSRTIRGQRAGFMIGESFWMSRLELGAMSVFARPVVFADFGWAGDRSDFARPGRIGSGVGIGASIFDGSMRLDIARGVWPGEGIRGMLYLDGWE